MNQHSRDLVGGIIWPQVGLNRENAVERGNWGWRIEKIVGFERDLPADLERPHNSVRHLLAGLWIRAGSAAWGIDPTAGR